MKNGAAILAALLIAAWPALALDLGKESGSVRVAQFNTALARKGAGLLLADIQNRHPQVLAVAEIILHVRPDAIVLNEIDHDPERRALDAFAALLREGVGDHDGLAYPYVFHGSVNSGEPSGLDLDGDGRTAGPDDAWGFGVHPGHYGMAFLSRLPIGDVRTYRLFQWAEMPDARRPANPDGMPFHPEHIWSEIRLSSRSHWILPLTLSDGTTLDIIAAHPTPPAFDGPENRNAFRNADEIRLIRAMIDGEDWLEDDTGRPGGLSPDSRFVVAGCLNADPADGAGRAGEIDALLAHSRVEDPMPEGPGGRAAADPGHRGDPALDTADFRDVDPGNLRVDYVLPSAGLQVTGSGVFWPDPDDRLHRLIGSGPTPISSDHRLIWVDIRP